MIFENSKVYDWLKMFSQVILPAIITLYAALGKIWNWDLVAEITATLAAIDAFLGAVLQISSNNYKKLQEAELEADDQK
jgi:hypothetical protein